MIYMEGKKFISLHFFKNSFGKLGHIFIIGNIVSRKWQCLCLYILHNTFGILTSNKQISLVRWLYVYIATEIFGIISLETNIEIKTSVPGTSSIRLFFSIYLLVSGSIMKRLYSLTQWCIDKWFHLFMTVLLVGKT